MRIPSSRHFQHLAVFGIFLAALAGAAAFFVWPSVHPLPAPRIPDSAFEGFQHHLKPEAAPPFAPSSPATIEAVFGDFRTQAHSVDRQAFHLVIADPKADSGAASPFIVATESWSGAQVTRGSSGSQIQTPNGMLSLTPQGEITLKDQTGRLLLWRGRVRHAAGNKMELTFQHDAPQRFYGSGNESLGKSGGLVHAHGVSAVGNGFTRIPFLWSTGGYGVLIANDASGIAWEDKDGALRWTIPGKYIDLYLMAAPDPYALLNVYSRITGRAPAPPAWTFGYLQSRWGYADSKDVRDKWRRFRSLHIPVDAFIYDYDWYRDDWNFNPQTFPHPERDLAEMHRLGLRFVGIRKPRVHGKNLAYAHTRRWTLMGADLRFDLPEARQWWAGAHAPLIRAGVDGWWNDEAESAYSQFYYMNQAELAGWRAATKKPFWSLNRAFAPGMQRLGAAAWTGDIPATWDALRNQPGTMLNWSLCGMPYVGQDIGGYAGTPSPELYVRWMQEGALVPVMRAHGAYNLERWPWAFGARALDASRKAILLRYRLRPYLMACAQETARSGAPLMRPLFFEFPNDPTTYDLEHEWLLGRDLLAAPVLEPGGKSHVYLPAGVWRDVSTGRRISGPRWIHRTVSLETIPLYVRANPAPGGVNTGL